MIKRMKVLSFAIFLVVISFPMVAPSRAADLTLDRKNVVIVLDASGSMRSRMRGGGGSKMDAAKAALREVLNDVPMDTHIGLLVFGAANVESGWTYFLGPRDDARLMRAIDLPIPRGRTPLGKYIRRAYVGLLIQRDKQQGRGTYRMLIVTDGKASDQKLVDKWVPSVIASGITIDVIGVAMKGRHPLATKSHSYRSAHDLTSLKKALADIFAEVANTGLDTAGKDVFDQIAPIPDEVAEAMLKALLSTSPKRAMYRAP